MYSAKVIADSVNPAGVRLTTIECSYPLMVHAEHLRHRVFSRSSDDDFAAVNVEEFSYSVASNRAIPTRLMLDQVRTDPVIPTWWGKNQPGMSAREELTGFAMAFVQRLWRIERWFALAFAWMYLRAGLHKQLANRGLYKWQWVTVVVTGTDWSNWNALRCHPDAQPEIRTIAEMMREAREKSTPVQLEAGEWHLPYVTTNDRFEVRYLFPDAAKANNVLARMSAARCARVSLVKQNVRYGNGIEIGKADTLQKSGHMSPFEAPCEALADDRRVANLRGYRSYRSQIKNEHDFSLLMNDQDQSSNKAAV